jgi:hypothetical protein
MTQSNILNKHPLTVAGLVSGLVLFGITAAFDLDVFEELVTLVQKGEAYEIDEFIIPVFLLMLGIVGDFFLITQQKRAEEEKLHVYNQMNEEVMNEISMHLTKLLEFRTAMMKEGAQSQDVRHELDRMIVRSFNHYERAQRRGDINSSLMPLAMQSVSKPPET